MSINLVNKEPERRGRAGKKEGNWQKDVLFYMPGSFASLHVLTSAS